MNVVKTAADLQALTGKGSVVLDFGANWCPPCKALAPIFADVSKLEQFKAIAFAKIDIDDSPDLANEYGVMSVPALVVIKSGAVTAMQSGVMGKPALTAWIANNV